MSEMFPDQFSALGRLQPKDFEPPVWAELPADIVRRLLAVDGPGIVTNPVVQRKFDSAQELIPDYPDEQPGHSGITYYFEPSQDGIGISDLVRNRPVFRRFQILYPDFVDELMQRMPSDGGNAPHELHEALFAAYNIMRHLVDRSDPGAIREGRPDDRLLVR